MNLVYLLSVVVAVVNNGAAPLAKSMTGQHPQGMTPPQQQLAHLLEEKQFLLAKLKRMKRKDADKSRIRKKVEEIRQVNEEIASIRQSIQQKPVPVVQPQPPNPPPDSPKEPKSKANQGLDSTNVNSETNFNFGTLPPSARILVPPQNSLRQDSQNNSTEPRPQTNSQLVPSEKNENFEKPAAAAEPEDLNIPKTPETQTVDSQNSSSTPTEIETTKQEISDDSNRKPVKETFENTTTEKRTALNPLTISLGFIVVAAIVGVLGLILYKKSKRNRAIPRVTSLSIDHGITQHEWMNTIRHSQASPGDDKFQDMDNLISELNSPIGFSKYESQSFQS